MYTYFKHKWENKHIGDCISCKEIYQELFFAVKWIGSLPSPSRPLGQASSIRDTE